MIDFGLILYDFCVFVGNKGLFSHKSNAFFSIAKLKVFFGKKIVKRNAYFATLQVFVFGKMPQLASK